MVNDKGYCLDCKKKCSGVRCRKCHYRNIGTVYKFGNWEFETAREMNITIKHLLDNCPMNVEFENDFFKELINTYHEGVRGEGLKVTKFKILDWHNQVGKWAFARDRFRGNKMVTGYFEPKCEWHGVTVYPHKKTSGKTKIIQALREKWSEKAPVSPVGQLCESCNVIPYPQLHHDNISFREIAEKCLVFFTDDELKYGLGNDWWKYESDSDTLSDDHPSVVEMFRLHKEVSYRWLCSSCHKEVHHGKKG